MGLSALELSKTVMYEFWHGYAKPKYDEKRKLYYIDTESFLVHIKQVIFIKTVQTMLKQCFKLQIMSWIDNYIKERMK